MNQPHPDFFSKDYAFNKDHEIAINSLISNLFSSYSKILPIRVDFYVKKEFTDKYGYFDLRFWLTKFRNNIRKNKLFEHYITYISKIEYAPLTGWHCHMVLFFNGQRVQNDIIYANSICRYWENVITKGIGRAYSSNLARMNENTWQSEDIENERYILGLVIGYSDHDNINKLRQICYYLAKETQSDLQQQKYLPKHMRAFNTGHVPLGNADRTIPRGRKRTHLYTQNPERSRALEEMRRKGTISYKNRY
ncbi:YagK/YfjJ domain-containing protein [Neisseria flavescens]|uniref:YagK/YfjJ domain-containing protein n=1 Tax=Neisseria flavescens TaxID=484 RepID=UPI0013E2C85F|nr:inovirus-type Gp2 protein [Neisseria flavescens]